MLAILASEWVHWLYAVDDARRMSYKAVCSLATSSVVAVPATVLSVLPTNGSHDRVCLVWGLETSLTGTKRSMSVNTSESIRYHSTVWSLRYILVAVSLLFVLLLWYRPTATGRLLLTNRARISASDEADETSLNWFFADQFVVVSKNWLGNNAPSMLSAKWIMRHLWPNFPVSYWSPRPHH